MNGEFFFPTYVVSHCESPYLTRMATKFIRGKATINQKEKNQNKYFGHVTPVVFCCFRLFVKYDRRIYINK
ncbi:hypothetical protein DCAR_0312382 [Daucus carota subsp. sativus]|uniref:Uncharacterized protein n=1 Tax=Daucus carota subsp. sativus TaxID=79200 RepID=A0A166AZH7_DAUCS|nr:hypothetical protein DCAR_0312382 [Daucus carota subsp. sativus]